MRLGEAKTRLCARITLSCQLGADLAAAATSRVGQKNLAGRVGMVGKKAGKERGVIPLIQQIAADNQVKASEFQRGTLPWRVEVADRREVVQVCIMTQELFGQGMVIACGDIRTTLLEYETGKADSAADFENVPALDREPAHFLRECQACRPHNAEYRPGCGRNTGTFRASVLV